jgi:D-ribose pyranase
MLVIGDAGLPVPPGVELIDLALTQGIPDFVSTLKVVLSETQVESHVLAEEILLKQPLALPVLEALTAEGAIGERRLLSHEEFKQLSRRARAIVRTGECQPYSNIVLVAGVTF